MLKKTSLIKPQMLLAQSLVLLTLGVMILLRPEMVNAMLSALLAVALIANAVVSLMIYSAIVLVGFIRKRRLITTKICRCVCVYAAVGEYS